MTLNRMLTLPLLAVSLTVAGCSGAPEQVSTDNTATVMPMPGNDMMSMGMKADANDPPATQGYKKSMSDMMANMPAYTGDADADFMRQMKVHHGSAIAMAEVELRHGKDATARALAEKIIGINVPKSRRSTHGWQPGHNPLDPDMMSDTIEGSWRTTR